MPDTARNGKCLIAPGAIFATMKKYRPREMFWTLALRKREFEP
jgi:hypothetical protein